MDQLYFRALGAGRAVSREDLVLLLGTRHSLIQENCSEVSWHGN
jgi:hypothetical protein